MLYTLFKAIMQGLSIFSSQKGSYSLQNRQQQFKELQKQHSSKTFIMIGPETNNFSGVLAVEFQSSMGSIYKQIYNDSSYSDTEVISDKQYQSDQQNRQFKNIKSEAKSYNLPQSLNSNRLMIDQVKGQQQSTICPQNYQKENKYSPIKETILPDLNSLVQLPMFNFDLRHYTPSFLLAEQLSFRKQSKLQFQNKLSQSIVSIKAQKIMFPRPKSKNNYCAVCRQRYEEYMGHIRGKIHKQKIESLLFSFYIKKLEQQINNEKKLKKQAQKSKKSDTNLDKKKKDIIKQVDNMISNKRVSQEQKKRIKQKKTFQYLREVKLLQGNQPNNKRKRKNSYELVEIKVRSREKELKKDDTYEQTSTATKIEAGKQFYMLAKSHKHLNS